MASSQTALPGASVINQRRHMSHNQPQRRHSPRHTLPSPQSLAFHLTEWATWKFQPKVRGEVVSSATVHGFPRAPVQHSKRRKSEVCILLYQNINTYTSLMSLINFSIYRGHIFPNIQQGQMLLWKRRPDLRGPLEQAHRIRSKLSSLLSFNHTTSHVLTWNR